MLKTRLSKRCSVLVAVGAGALLLAALAHAVADARCAGGLRRAAALSVLRPFAGRCLCAALGAALWPQDVRGLVLVSPTHSGLWGGFAPDVQRRIVSSTRTAKRCHGARAWECCRVESYDNLAGSLTAERRAARFFARDATHLQALAEEAALTLPESPLLAPLCVESQEALPTEWLIETEPPGGPFEAARRALAARMSAQPGLQVTEVATDHVGLLPHPQAAARLAECIEALLQRLALAPR